MINPCPIIRIKTFVYAIIQEKEAMLIVSQCARWSGTLARNTNGYIWFN